MSVNNESARSRRDLRGITVSLCVRIVRIVRTVRVVRTVRLVRVVRLSRNALMSGESRNRGAVATVGGAANGEGPAGSEQVGDRLGSRCGLMTDAGSRQERPQAEADLRRQHSLAVFQGGASQVCVVAVQAAERDEERLTCQDERQQREHMRQALARPVADKGVEW